MLVLIQEYAKGGRLVSEFSDDGKQYLAELDGSMQAGERTRAWLQAACEGSAEGYDRLLEDLAWLKEEVQKRKQALRAPAA